MANYHNNRNNYHNYHNNHNNHHGGHSNRNHHNGHNNQNRDNQVIHTFVLGTKELDNKTAEFQYDKGWYSITDIVGEEKNVIYKSKNAQEAYSKWNVYIGRRKERLQKTEKTE